MKMNQTMAVFLVLLGTLFCQDAQAFYNPSTGRWLSRDPIEEKGGKNLYGFVKNDAQDMIDVLGLEYHEEIKSDMRENIIRTYGVLAFTGEAGKKNQMATPHPLSPTTHVIKSVCECSAVVRAQQVDVNVLTVLPNNSIGVWHTENGYTALEGHEARRRLVYQKAYEAYIAPIQGNGSLVRKCNILCRFKSNDAAAQLSTWLRINQRMAIKAFNNWVRTQQGNISDEEWTTVNVNGNKLRDTISIYAVPSPPPFAGLPCPPSD